MWAHTADRSSKENCAMTDASGGCGATTHGCSSDAQLCEFIAGQPARISPLRQKIPSTISTPLDWELCLTQGSLWLSPVADNVLSSAVVILVFSRSPTSYVVCMATAVQMHALRVNMALHGWSCHLGRAFWFVPPDMCQKVLDEIRPMKPHASWVIVQGCDVHLVLDAVEQIPKRGKVKLCRIIKIVFSG